jgi:RpiR family carbohydrate utilization transcriptional regulator
MSGSNPNVVSLQNGRAAQLSTHNLIETITQSLPNLRKSDRKVAETILRDPPKATEMKLAELARASGVSEPTVVRFCNSVGCVGFQDMRLKLAKSLAFGMSTSHGAISEEDALNEVVNKIFDFNLTSLDWVRTNLNVPELERTVEAIMASKSLHFIGLGASSIVAQDAQQKFPLFGVATHASVDVHQMLIAASMMGEGDVLFAVSNSGNTREVIQATRHAKQRGATTVAITGANSPLLRHCDIGLLVETLENTDDYTPTISRVAALVVIDILSTVVALRREPEERQKVMEMKRYIADVRATGVI